MQRPKSFIDKCRLALAAAAWACLSTVAWAQTQMPSGTPIPQIQDAQGTTGPYRLRTAPAPGGTGNVYIPAGPRSTDTPTARYVPGEFEQYVNRLANSPVDAPIRRFGADLIIGVQLVRPATSTAGSSTDVPPGSLATSGIGQLPAPVA
ncbi:MAG TPA: hypothetical protein VMT14_16330, partial [Burkholderiaceae bacterium]|nr:hypothetical protein [Burkholderiaceae bacterium]